MAIVRWGIGGVLIALFLLPFAVPERFRQAGQAASQQRPKRVYTNDDAPFNRPTPSAPSAATGIADPSGRPREAERLAPFVPTPMEIVDKMLELARVGPDDTVYDLGSGDGRIVFRAAQKYGAKGVGVELDERLAKDSQNQARELKLDKLVTIIHGDILQTDIQPATVVTIYLLISANERIRPMLEKTLKPGTRVVAHDMRVPGWEPYREEAVPMGSGTHFVYLYRIPEAFQRPPAR